MQVVFDLLLIVIGRKADGRQLGDGNVVGQGADAIVRGVCLGAVDHGVHGGACRIRDAPVGAGVRSQVGSGLGVRGQVRADAPIRRLVRTAIHVNRRTAIRCAIRPGAGIDTALPVGPGQAAKIDGAVLPWSTPSPLATASQKHSEHGEIIADDHFGIGRAQGGDTRWGACACCSILGQE